ncbi:hypothetical protein V8G54_009171 [Vigna mungo]|uniref:RRM domain-containing protein n=1 Tax=Vigna mungo TaxID=3915 RepID=A0AAQ3S577_VIGMU
MFRAVKSLEGLLLFRVVKSLEGLLLFRVVKSLQPLQGSVVPAGQMFPEGLSLFRAVKSFEVLLLFATIDGNPIPAALHLFLQFVVVCCCKSSSIFDGNLSRPLLSKLKFHGASSPSSIAVQVELKFHCASSPSSVAIQVGLLTLATIEKKLKTLEPKTFVNIKAGDGMTMGWTLGKEEIENPRQQQREEVKPHVSLVVVAMAEHLPSMFGTGTVMVNCHSTSREAHCSDMITPGGNAHGNPLDHRQIQDHFEEFYEDIFEELSKYGEIESLKVCDNLADHMAGNVYVKFSEEEHVTNVVRNLAGRFYAGRPVIVDFSLVTVFQGVTCRQYEENICNRHGCNFMHLKRISWDLRHQLFGKHHRRISNSKSRYGHRSHDEQSYRNHSRKRKSSSPELRGRSGSSRRKKGRKEATWVDVLTIKAQFQTSTLRTRLRIRWWDHVYHVEREFGSLGGCYNCAVAILNTEYTLIGVSVPGLEAEFQPVVNYLLPHILSHKQDPHDIHLQLLQDVTSRLLVFLPQLETDLSSFPDNPESNLRFLAMLAVGVASVEGNAKTCFEVVWLHKKTSHKGH